MARGTANKIGVCSLFITVLFWSAVLTPFGRNHGFHGDIIVTKVVILISLVGAIVAAMNGSRWWVILLIMSLFTTAIVLIAPL